jgi:hypothetical protein
MFFNVPLFRDPLSARVLICPLHARSRNVLICCILFAFANFCKCVGSKVRPWAGPLQCLFSHSLVGCNILYYNSLGHVLFVLGHCLCLPASARVPEARRACVRVRWWRGDDFPGPPPPPPPPHPPALSPFTSSRLSPTQPTNHHNKSPTTHYPTAHPTTQPQVLSTAFYRTAHFRKLQDALEKEFFLQVWTRVDVGWGGGRVF